MFKAMEQIPNGEFTGFILEAETKEDILSQIINSFSEKTGWFVIDEIKKIEYFYNSETESLEEI